MKIEGNQITFPKTLEVKYSGKLIEKTESQITIEGEDEDSYLKIYSPFRGIAKLLLFENGQWVDAESGSSNFDFSSLGMGNLPNFGDSNVLGGDLPDFEETDNDSGKEEIVDAEYVDIDNAPTEAAEEKIDSGKKVPKRSTTKKKPQKASAKKADANKKTPKKKKEKS